MENKIYVFVSENNIGTLKFPKYNIETNAYIGINGITSEKKEGDGKTPLGEFELGIAFLTVPTTTSPILADFTLEPPRTRITKSSLAPVLSATFNLVSC